METARQTRLRWTLGILASIAFNGILLSIVGFQAPVIRSVPKTDEQKAITAALIVLPKQAPAAARHDRQALAPGIAPHAATSLVERNGAAVPRPAVTPAPPQASPDAPAGDEADVRERVGRALRGMAACATFEVDSQDRQKPACGKSWAGPGAAIDPASSGMRAQIQAEKSRSDDAVSLGNRFRSDLRDHSAQGNNAHFGCLIDTGGKLKCSTY